MSKRLALILLLFPVIAMGQYHISGKIVDSASKKPVANASVFLSNASVGAKTNEEGSYDIANVRSGHYDLVVSNIGFNTYHQDIAVNSDINLSVIEVKPKTITLKEVNIGPDVNWDRNYALFKRQFLGNSETARACKILNPEVISISYSQTKGLLTASSYDFIEIDNKTLGYKVKYLLTKLTMNYANFGGGFLYYEGSPLFEDLKGSKSDIKRWQKKRLETYMGSEMHFLRSVISNRVAEEGFTVRRLIRKPNPEYGNGSYKKYIETLITTPLGIADYVKLTDQPGQYALAFNDCLYVTYHKMPENIYQASIITFAEPYVYFDNNGIIINAKGAVIEDTWGDSRLAEMLPVDYEPPVSK